MSEHRRFSFHRLKKQTDKKDDDGRIDKELAKIYKNNDGSMPDMRHFQKSRRNRLAAAIVTMLFSCLFLAGVAWAGFFVLQPGKNFSEKDVVLSVSGDSKVSFGQEARYRVRYKNVQNVALGRAVLQVRYPEGFVFSSASLPPTNSANDEWSLGAIEANGSGYLDIIGRIYGNVGETKSFRVFLNYIPANFNSEFQKVATSAVEMASSSTAIDLQGMDSVVPGKESVLIIVVKSRDELKNAAVNFEPPAGFVKKSSLPKTDDFDAYAWNFDSLKGEKKIEVKGVFASGSLGAARARVVSWKDDKRQGNGFVIAEVSRDLASISATPVNLSLAINGSANDSSVIPGETLTISLVLKNGSQSPIKNISARLILDTPYSNKKSFFDWSKIQDSLDGNIAGEQLSPDRRRGSIVWDKAKNPAFKELIVSGESVLDIQLPLRSAGSAELPEFTSFDINALAEAQYELDGKKEVVVSLPIKLIVNSDLSFEVRGSSSSVSGKQTHSVDWILNNTFHALKGITVEADVYGDIVWDKDRLAVPSGEATFDEKTKKLVWKIASMPTSVDILALHWQVIMNTQNPTQSNLTSKVKIQATDTVTGEEILKTGEEILLK